MSCPTCAPLEAKVKADLPYTVRTCKNCGSNYRFQQFARHGTGIKMKKGERFVLPPGFVKLSANPLKGQGHFTRSGIGWFAELVFGVDLAKKENREDPSKALTKIQESNEVFFRGAEFLRGLDLDDPKNEQAIFDRMQQHQKTPEWWGYMAGLFCAVASDAVRKGDAATAAWAASTAERFRALAVFKVHFEDVVWMGHSAGRLVDLIRVWDANRQNSDEGFWQITLGDHSYAFSQLFSVPVTFIQDRAYVGGTQIDGRDARYLDFMLSGGSANHAILVEIKAPTTPLLGAKYRKNVYPPSKALARISQTQGASGLRIWENSCAIKDLHQNGGAPDANRV